MIAFMWGTLRMIKMIEFVQPYDENCIGTLWCRITVEDAAAVQCSLHPNFYTSDEDAALDFMANHFGNFIEVFG